MRWGFMEEKQFAFPPDICNAYILIAVCDCEESARVHELLRQAGITFFSFAFDSDAALAWAKRIRPNVQILSSSYPDMKGLQLYDWMYQVASEPPVPTLFLGKRQLHVETESGHCIIGMEKPYTDEQLLQAVETLLRYSREKNAHFNDIEVRI
jgi:DNA-binding response OmpR family regulator